VRHFNSKNSTSPGSSAAASGSFSRADEVPLEMHLACRAARRASEARRCVDPGERGQDFMADIIADLNAPQTAAVAAREGGGQSVAPLVPLLHVQGAAHASSSTQPAAASTDQTAPSTARSIGISGLAREVSARAQNGGAVCVLTQASARVRGVLLRVATTVTQGHKTLFGDTHTHDGHIGKKRHPL